MDILQIRNKIDEALKAKGVNSTIDPYYNFKEVLTRNPPEAIALTESGDNTDFTLSGGGGVPYKAEYSVSITCMIYADQKTPHSTFKPAAIAFGKQVLSTVVKVDFLSIGCKLKNIKQRDGEFIVDGVKVSGVTIDIAVESAYNINE